MNVHIPNVSAPYESLSPPPFRTSHCVQEQGLRRDEPSIGKYGLDIESQRRTHHKSGMLYLRTALYPGCWRMKRDELEGLSILREVSLG